MDIFESDISIGFSMNYIEGICGEGYGINGSVHLSKVLSETLSSILDALSE